MSSQENAEAVLIVIKRLAKWILMGIIIIALLGGVMYLWSTFSDWYQVGRYKSKITVNVKFDKAECPEKDYPLSIFVGNTSTKTIEHISVDVKVTNFGYSNKINDYSSFANDKLIEPNKGFQTCWRVNSETYGETLDGQNMAVVLESFDVNFVE